MTKNTYTAPYDPIAEEYYDLSHKTCRNFDETTLNALNNLQIEIPKEGLVLDVGAGRGRCIEFLRLTPNRIVQLDSSINMLQVSPREECAIKILHEAEQLPFTSDTFHVVTGFLCDPFLGLTFLHEAHRVLTKDGLFVATTPSHEWGTPLRRDLEVPPLSTRFITKKREKVIVPSAIYPRKRLLEMLRLVGFSKVIVTGHKLPRGSKEISPDIVVPARALGLDVHDLDILYLIQAKK